MSFTAFRIGLSILLTIACQPAASDFEFLKMFYGNGHEEVHAVAFGPDGSLYVAGTTTSTDFEVTPGALRGMPPHPEPRNFREPQIYFRRLSRDGKTLLTSALLGPLYEGRVAMKVDTQGNAYFAFIAQTVRWKTSGLPIPELSRNTVAVAVLLVSPTGNEMRHGMFLERASVYSDYSIVLAVSSPGIAFVGQGGKPFEVLKLDLLSPKSKLSIQSRVPG